MVNQWQETNTVINWFRNIKNKKMYFYNVWYWRILYFNFKGTTTLTCAKTLWERNQHHHALKKVFTPHLEANKYLSKICKSSSCIFSKHYMLTDNKKMKIFYWADFFNVGLKLHGQNWLFKVMQNQNNQI